MTRERTEIVFVCTIFGGRLLPFLAPHLHTVNVCHPEAREVVLWQDLPESEVELLSRGFPHASFLPLGATIRGSLDERISQKLKAWNKACQMHPNSAICFLDVDCLLVQPLTPMLDANVDVTFTWKDEPAPVNTGVILVGGGERGCVFLQEWEKRTLDIVANPSALARACAVSGGGDQQSFRELVGFANYDGCFTRSIGGLDIRCRGVPCSTLNETRSVPISAETRVIHYKGGWHSILLDGTGFTANRPRDASAEMYAYWHKQQRLAHRQVAAAAVEQASAKAPSSARVVDGARETGASPTDVGLLARVCKELAIDTVIMAGDMPRETATAIQAALTSIDVNVRTSPKRRAFAAALRRSRSSEPRSALAVTCGENEKLVDWLMGKFTATNSIVAAFVFNVSDTDLPVLDEGFLRVFFPRVPTHGDGNQNECCRQGRMAIVFRGPDMARARHVGRFARNVDRLVEAVGHQGIARVLGKLMGRSLRRHR